MTMWMRIRKKRRTRARSSSAGRPGAARRGEAGARGAGARDRLRAHPRCRTDDDVPPGRSASEKPIRRSLVLGSLRSGELRSIASERGKTYVNVG